MLNKEEEQINKNNKKNVGVSHATSHQPDGDGGT